MINEKIKCSFECAPFKSTLSFEYLIAELKNVSKIQKNPFSEAAQKVLKKLDDAPMLKKPIEDFKVIRENRDLVDQLMLFVFNPLNDNLDISAAMAPFTPKMFYSTKLFDDGIKGEHIKIELAKDTEKDSMFLAVVYQAYLIILQKFYGFNPKIDVPFIYKLTNEQDQSEKYYKMVVNSKYTNVKVHGKLNKLSEIEMKELFDRSTDLDFWNEKIPLEKFEFTGFIHFSYIDITAEYVISQLKSDLLDKNFLVSQEGFEGIRQKIRALMEIQDLEFGLAAFSDFNSNINQNAIWKSIIPDSELKCEEYKGSMYETAYVEKRIVITDDIKTLKGNKVVSAFLKRGLSSHIIVPLLLDEELVGMIEFGSKEPGKLNMVQVKRFHELFPVFGIALKRSKEELNDKLRAIIQEECTAIHPAVEWRFQEAASKMLDVNLSGGASTMEPIIFSDVVPIYGATDIRNSSVERTNAIQADLTEQLALAKDVLLKGLEHQDMPLLDNLIYKIGLHMQTVSSGLKAGDEVSILEFLNKEIEPVFLQLRSRDQGMKKVVEGYFNQMDKELGVIYKKRKDFEDSLTMINDVVGEVLDDEQLKAQKVFPHYFEKYRTDGIEYNAYVGQSLVQEVEYNEIYLKNIRLWQLLSKVKIARKIRGLIPSLKTKLDVTQLILVHSNPLSITFRQDEKKFDVAGAYNIRYEITKKRIDKAVIKGTQDRLTQVGKIAIIYSHAEEIEEYKKYIEYMIAKGYLKEVIEDFELEDMKGASGLRALRVEVDFGAITSIDDIVISEVSEMVEPN